jgi:hypothetical protein
MFIIILKIRVIVYLVLYYILEIFEGSYEKMKLMPQHGCEES